MIEVINFSSTTPVHFNAVQKKKTSKQTTQNNQAINKNYSSAISNNALASINLKKSNNLSFGRLFYAIPGTFESMEVVRREYNFKEPSPEDLSKYAQKHPLTTIPVYEINMQMHDMYSFPIGNKVDYVGVAYMDKNGRAHTFREDAVRKSVKSDEKTTFNTQDIVYISLVNNRNFEEAKLYDRQNSPQNIYAQRAAADICIRDGRYDEALARFPEQKEYINSIVNDIKNRYVPSANAPKRPTITDMLAAGNIKGVKELGDEYLPESLKRYEDYELETAYNFVNDNEELKKWTTKQHLNAFKDASFEVYDQYSVWERLGGLVTTLGFTEILNLINYVITAKYNLDRENKNIKQIKGAVADMLTEIHNAKVRQLEETKAQAHYEQHIEEHKERIKTQLQSDFIVPFVLAHKKENNTLPNCIMLTGENPYVMQELIDWTADVSMANYIKIPSNKDKNEMQKQIFEGLEQAEEKYKKTGMRSIIFINGMEDLLNPEFNTRKNIAAMKDIMSSANEDYHSTIMFYTQDPSKLDKGTTVSHRVGINIEVPIKFNKDFCNLIKL